FYSSSDVEVKDDQPNKYKNVGKRAVASIAQASVVDRIESKKAFKKLKLYADSPSTNY
ncbi:hypothetical protein LTR66_013383, partial [Elasticomyces elasticus]